MAMKSSVEAYRGLKLPGFGVAVPYTSSRVARKKAASPINPRKVCSINEPL